MKKSIKLSALLATLMLTSTAFAASQGHTQADGSPVVKNAYGECWKLPTTYDKARDGLVECGDREPAEPVVVAPAPKPAPAPVVVAPKVQTVIKTVSLSAEGLFGFNSAQIVAGNQQLLSIS